MIPGRDRAVSFLKMNDMFFGDIDLDGECARFLSEMTGGLQAPGGLEGTGGSLQMIPTYIEADRDIPPNEPVIAIDAGGTNFRVARVQFDGEGKPGIDRYAIHPMPGLERELSGDEFFQRIIGYLDPLLASSDKMGVCFSYPTEISPRRDGRLIHFTKEIRAREVEGQYIGEGLLSALRESGRANDKRVVLLNDTVATLLAGKSAVSAIPYDSYIGFILGTGTNCCYIESNGNIGKLDGLDPTRSMIVNIESGGYGKGPTGSIDDTFDRTLNNPGQNRFEKMLSGAYFGPLLLTVFKAAAEDGLLSREVGEELRNVDSLTTKRLNDFYENPLGADLLSRRILSGCPEDLAVLYHLVDCLIERSALLTAINLSSAVLKLQAGKSPCSPVCITAEGSVFHGLKSLKGRVCRYLREYLRDTKGYYVDFAAVENAPLIGAAIAGLTNYS